MSKGAAARLARLNHTRTNARGVTLTAKVYEGPQSEIGRSVHIPVTHADLPELRRAVEELEARHEGA